MKKTSLFISMFALLSLNEAIGQWNTSGNNIYNTNSGNVGIGSSSPTTLLHVQKNMTEPTITVQNLGGIGGATYTMMDNVSGANWKFKATNSGGFKIRDHASGLDVFFIEQNSAANLLYLKSGGNIGINTSTPASSALVDMTSTTKGFLIPRMTQSQIEDISVPADGLQVYCTTNGKMYLFVATLGQWKEIAFGSGILIPGFTCGMSITANHVAGDVAPVTKTTTYGTVTNIPGATSSCWITSNLGSDHQATAVDDITEPSAGWYWQFNRKQGYKHDGSTITPTWTIDGSSESSNWIAANDPCTIELGSGWRIPTYTEWDNVKVSGSWANWNGPWNSDLKMHAAGWLGSNGSLHDRGSSGFYVSATQFSLDECFYMQFNSTFCVMNAMGKGLGYSVRCIKE